MVSASRKRADRLVAQLLQKRSPNAPAPTPTVGEEPSKPQSIAARLKGIGESRRKTLAIVRASKRFI